MQCNPQRWDGPAMGASGLWLCSRGNSLIGIYGRSALNAGMPKDSIYGITKRGGFNS